MRIALTISKHPWWSALAGVGVAGLLGWFSNVQFVWATLVWANGVMTGFAGPHWLNDFAHSWVFAFISLGMIVTALWRIGSLTKEREAEGLVEVASERAALAVQQDRFGATVLELKAFMGANVGRLIRAAALNNGADALKNHIARHRPIVENEIQNLHQQAQTECVVVGMQHWGLSGHCALNWAHTLIDVSVPRPGVPAPVFRPGEHGGSYYHAADNEQYINALKVFDGQMQTYLTQLESRVSEVRAESQALVAATYHQLAPNAGPYGND